MNTCTTCTTCRFLQRDPTRGHTCSQSTEDAVRAWRRHQVSRWHRGLPQNATSACPGWQSCQAQSKPRRRS